MQVRAMQSPMRIAGRPTNWRGKGLLRVLLLVVAAITIAALGSIFGIAHDYSYLRASLLSGTPGGNYHALATSLAARASRGHGNITVVPTAGSVEDGRRLAKNQGRCAAAFAFVQDGTPGPAGGQLEALGRLPQSQSLLLLGGGGPALSTFA